MSVKKKICIVDYGFGNISSLENTLNYTDFKRQSIEFNDLGGKSIELRLVVLRSKAFF